MGLTELTEEAKKAKQRLEDLEQQIAEARRLDEVERTRMIRPLVTKAHALMCHFNHTDGCSWGYEEDHKRDDPEAVWVTAATYGVQRNYSSHGRWVEVVRKVLDDMKMTPAEFDEFLDYAQAMKTKFPRFSSILQMLR